MTGSALKANQQRQYTTRSAPDSTYAVQTRAYQEGHAAGQASGYDMGLEGLRQAVFDVIIREFDLVPGDIYASAYQLREADALRSLLLVILESQSMNDVRHWLDLRGAH